MNKPVLVHNARETALVARHASLEARIVAETKRTTPNLSLVAQLKKAKLKIKDTLSTASA